MEIQHLMRQMELIPVEALGLPIHIIGAGAIGSFTALSLAKMGFGNLTVYDDDKIEPENMNCQFYPLMDIGKPKVAALKEMIQAFSGFEILTHEKRYEGGHLPGVVISAVDSMAARKLIWEGQKGMARTMVIDPRMGAETGLLYVMNPSDEKDISSYEKTLYDDGEAVQERCTAKSTIYCCLLLSGLVAATVKQLATMQRYTRIAQWDIPTMELKRWLKADEEKSATKEEGAAA